jgi:hypothetical protein
MDPATRKKNDSVAEPDELLPVIVYMVVVLVSVGVPLRIPVVELKVSPADKDGEIE